MVLGDRLSGQVLGGSGACAGTIAGPFAVERGEDLLPQGEEHLSDARDLVAKAVVLLQRKRSPV
jgi:hypothetical protein